MKSWRNETKEREISSHAEPRALDRMVEVEFHQLAIKSDVLRGFGLQRPPTWDELFDAVHPVVQRISWWTTEKCNIILMGPTDNANSGRCVLYAGLVWALLDLFLENGAAVNIGSASTICFGGPNGVRRLALDPDNPNRTSDGYLTGGYHAWTVLEPRDVLTLNVAW
jgi:hypothetical protein